MVTSVRIKNESSDCWSGISKADRWLTSSIPQFHRDSIVHRPVGAFCEDDITHCETLQSHAVRIVGVFLTSHPSISDSSLTLQDCHPCNGVLLPVPDLPPRDICFRICSVTSDLENVLNAWHLFSVGLQIEVSQTVKIIDTSWPPAEKHCSCSWSLYLVKTFASESFRTLPCGGGWRGRSSSAVGKARR